MDDVKAALRRRVRAARAARAPGDPSELLATARRAGVLDPGRSAEQVGALRLAAYLAMPGEPDPGPIAAAVAAAGGRVLLPVPLPDRTMAWAVDDGSRGQAPAPLRVPVPLGPRIGVGAGVLLTEAVSVLLLPALAVDRDGHRLGQGGGFYDRLLGELAALTVGPAVGPAVGPGSWWGPTRLAAGPLVVAVVHDEEVLAAGAVPVAPHDQPVDAVLTPSRFLRF